MAGKPLDPKKLAQLDKLTNDAEKKMAELKALSQKSGKAIDERSKGLKSLPAE